MKNGDVLFLFRVRYTSPDKAYDTYVCPYVCLYRNKKGVVFQPTEVFIGKPPYLIGLWSDKEHFLNSPEKIQKYFHITEERAERLIEELRSYASATRGVKIVDSGDLLDHINTELRRFDLPGYRTIENVYANTENWAGWSK